MSSSPTTQRQDTTEPTAARRLRTADLLILSIGTFTLGVDGFVLAGLLPQVASSLHVSVSTAGQLTTLFALAYALGSPVIAAVAGNWDRRTLLAAGMTVFLAGIIVQATGPDFAVVACGRVLAALGAAGYQATAYSTAGILSDDEHRARSLAVVAGGSSVAIVAGLPFGILVGQTWGWRSAMWVLVVLAALSILAVRLLPPAHAPRMSLRQRGEALTDPRVLGILAGTVTVLTPAFIVIAYLPAIMHTSGAWIVVAMLAYGTGQVAGTVVVPRLIRRRSARMALLLGACGITVVTAVLTLTRYRPCRRDRDDGGAGPCCRPQRRAPTAPAFRYRAQARSGGHGPQWFRHLHRQRPRSSCRRGGARRRRQHGPHHHRGDHRPACRRHRQQGPRRPVRAQ